jgi:hypothetical protein
VPAEQTADIAIKNRQNTTGVNFGMKVFLGAKGTKY